MTIAPDLLQELDFAAPEIEDGEPVEVETENPAELPADPVELAYAEVDGAAPVPAEIEPPAKLDPLDEAAVGLALAINRQMLVLRTLEQDLERDRHRAEEQMRYADMANMVELGQYTYRGPSAYNSWCNCSPARGEYLRSYSYGALTSSEILAAHAPALQYIPQVTDPAGDDRKDLVAGIGITVLVAIIACIIAVCVF